MGKVEWQLLHCKQNSYSSFVKVECLRWDGRLRMRIDLAFITRGVKEDVIASCSMFSLEDPKTMPLATGVRKYLKETASQRTEMKDKENVANFSA